MNNSPAQAERLGMLGWPDVSADSTDGGRGYREMFDALPAAIYTTDARGRLTYFNPACVEFSGRTPRLGSDHWCVTWKLYHPDGTPMPHDQCPMAIALKEGRDIRGAEAIAERPDGSRIWFMPHPTALRDAAGNVVGGINMLVDITARKQAEMAKASLAAIVESSDDAIISKSLDGIISSWNRGAERLFGYTAAEAVGKSVTMLMPPDRVNEEPGILERIRRGESVDHYETVRRRKDGTLIHVSLCVSPLRDAAGRVVGASKIARDITEQHLATENLARAKEEAEAANIAKDNFLANLSHELRTPLTPVLATLSSWEADPAFPKALADDLEMVRRNVDLEARLIDDLLDLTRIAKGKIALNFEVLDLQRVLDAVVAMYLSDVRRKRIELSVRRLPGERYVRADAGRLQQVFWNVLKNAVKFTPEGGKISIVTAEDPQGDCRVTVTDTGVGIGADMLRRLFQPFEQETAGNYGGLGLGLAITKALLEAQDGRIEARSDGPGKGASFTVTLPCVPQPLTNAVVASPRARESACVLAEGGYRLLLVEDHADTARVLARLLGDNGHTVTTTRSIAEALGAMRADDFDVLVSDVGLPDGTGIDLIRAVREELGKTTPAVALTGFGMEDDVRRTLQAGFNDHLTKPVNFARLEQTIRLACGGRTGTRRG